MSQESGFWIPKNLQENMIKSGFKLHHVFVVAHVHSMQKNGQRFYASNEYIGRLLGVTPRRASQIISELTNNGWLKRMLTAEERVLVVTDKVEHAREFPPSMEKNFPKRRKKTSTNNIVDNRVNNRDLEETTTSKIKLSSDEGIRTLIAKDIGDIEKSHEVFAFYDAAYKWGLLRENVDISRNPNTSVIQQLMYRYTDFGSLRDFVYFLDGRWQQRNIRYRSESANLSWLLLLDCDDDMMVDGILSTEGEEEYTIKSVNDLVSDLMFDTAS